MAGTGPVAIGTRGTVGSLLRREMEYFSKLELGSNCSRPNSAEDRNVETTSRRAFPGSSLRFWRIPWRGKKLLVPGICSVVEVAERSRCSEDKIPGFSYRILRDECKNMQL